MRVGGRPCRVAYATLVRVAKCRLDEVKVRSDALTDARDLRIKRPRWRPSS